MDFDMYCQYFVTDFDEIRYKNLRAMPFWIYEFLENWCSIDDNLFRA